MAFLDIWKFKDGLTTTLSQIFVNRLPSYEASYCSTTNSFEPHFDKSATYNISDFFLPKLVII
jgi:hypothetical protein